VNRCPLPPESYGNQRREELDEGEGVQLGAVTSAGGWSRDGVKAVGQKSPTRGLDARRI
jgi:hypothetical protein